jgi:hypothetical protein
MKGTDTMTTEEKLGQVTIKGRTVDEVIDAMEEAATTVLGQLDEYLVRLSCTRSMEVPGTPAAFAAMLAQEAKLSRAVLDRILELVNQLPDPVSVWDVQNAVTAVANQANYVTMMRLQSLGGALSFDAETMIQRCHTCERLL